jgi:primosomal protein N' (replication factor Y) (superfamily II helicase)
VPDVPSFSVDDGFAYSVPEDLELEIGAIVRVPLGGRRVRGWVVAIGDGDGSKLRAVLSRSGDLPVFDRRFLDVMRWAAVRYVAPLAALLAKATPPNIPRRRSWKGREPFGDLPAGQLADLSANLAAGKRPGTEVWLGGGTWAEPIAAAIAPALAAGRNGVVVTATVAENEVLTADLQSLLGDCVISSASGGTGAQQTRAWVEAATRSGTLVVGTRATGFWHIGDLAAAFVVGEGRRGMKDKSTPTTHVREVLVKRSQMERFGLVLCGTVPTAEALAVGTPRRVPKTGRMWGQVEVVDRRTEDSDGALLGPTARSALRSAVSHGTPVLLFTHRRATAQRCARCKALRKCSSCGSGSFEAGECARCGTLSESCHECEFSRFEMMGSGASRVAAEAGRVIGRENVGEPGSGRLVVVGTERDLPGMTTGLTIIVDADGPILAPTYRAAEDALRLLARAIGVAGLGRGRRGLIQTSDPTHPVVEALRRADPLPFLRADSADRAAAGFPPGGEVLVLEVEDPPAAASEELEAAVGARAEILGPAESGGRVRWLLQGKDLSAARVALRSVVSRWREGGARVRIDADPVDL